MASGRISRKTFSRSEYIQVDNIPAIPKYKADEIPYLIASGSGIPGINPKIIPAIAGITLPSNRMESLHLGYRIPIFFAAYDIALQRRDTAKKLQWRRDKASMP